MSKKLEAVAVSGPTTDDNENLVKFSFNNPKYQNTIRHGVPDHFDFSWVVTSPTTLKSSKPHYYSWGEDDKKKHKEEGKPENAAEATDKK